MLLRVVAGAQDTESENTANAPAVTLIGEDEALLSVLSRTHPGALLNVFGNDMDLAYEKWMHTLAAIEDYSQEIGYDIRGLKTYLLVYWNADGTVRCLGFYPKPNSRNIPIAELKAFFKGFVRDYQLPVSAETGFSHYASGAFPLHDRIEYSVRKN